MDEILFVPVTIIGMILHRIFLVIENLPPTFQFALLLALIIAVSVPFLTKHKEDSEDIHYGKSNRYK